MGERYFFLPDFMRVLSEASIAYLQPDPMRAGGLGQTRTVADLCDARKVSFAPHNSPGTGPVATAASLHLAASSHAFSILEAREGLSEAERRVCTLRLDLDDGHVALPEGPGLGIDLDWEALSRDPVVGMVMPRGIRVDGTIEDY